jgi:hypothetical protein
LEATLSRAAVVEDAVGSPLADSPAIDEKLRLSRHDAFQQQEHRRGDGRRARSGGEGFEPISA